MMPNELVWEAARRQTHCYTCGRRLGPARYECPTCGEISCSEECREKHIKTMDDK
jgi:predicted RNA-binding Zn-ribbon protein involved in translation (DUF1610 family)